MHTDRNDILNQEESDYLNTFVHMEGTTEKILMNNYVCNYMKYFRNKSQKYGKWTICCWLPVVSNKNISSEKSQYYQYFVLESLGCVLDISSENLVDNEYGTSYGSHFLGSTIQHGTAIPITIDNEIVKYISEETGWIQFSWGRSGGPSSRHNKY